jgi:hypothetical protein
MFEKTLKSTNRIFKVVDQELAEIEAPKETFLSMKEDHAGLCRLAEVTLPVDPHMRA